LSSAIGAIVLATALAVAEVMNAPRSEVGTILISHFPVLAVGALGVYGRRDVADDDKLGRQHDVGTPPSGARCTWPNTRLAWLDRRAWYRSLQAVCNALSAGRTRDSGYRRRPVDAVYRRRGEERSRPALLYFFGPQPFH
jgi:hypothetical protein